MAAILAPDLFQQFTDDDGHPVTNGLLYVYAAGTTTPIDTYADASGLVANANPVVLDDGGHAPTGLWLSPGVGYKFMLYTALGALVDSVDRVIGGAGTATNRDVTGIAGETIAANQAVYMSNGTSTYTPPTGITTLTTAGLWYVAHADTPASSTQVEVGFALGAVTVSSSFTIRQAGELDGLTGLVPGADYYIAATPGQITSSVPLIQRFVGVAMATTSLLIDANPIRPAVLTATAQGRITLTSMMPVTVVDVSAATTVYYTPYQGNMLALYNNLRWGLYAFTEQSLALGADTANLVYDLFAYLSPITGGVLIERLAWASTTARATALVLQDGVYLKSGALDRRYLGSYATTAVAGQTEDSHLKRLAWNATNRINRPLRRRDSTDTWTFNTGAYRQANGSAANQVTVVCGLQEDLIALRVYGACQNSNGTPLNAAVSIGENSTITPATQVVNQARQLGQTGMLVVPVTAEVETTPPLGLVNYTWLEYSDNTGTTTWVGDFGAPLLYFLGMTGTWVA